MEARVFANDGVGDLNGKRNNLQAHVAERHLASELLLQLRLDLVVVLIDIDDGGQSKYQNHNNDDDRDHDSGKLAHKPSLSYGADPDEKRRKGGNGGPHARTTLNQLGPLMVGGLLHRGWLHLARADQLCSKSCGMGALAYSRSHRKQLCHAFFPARYSRVLRMYSAT